MLQKHYNRNQTAILLEITGGQLDYLALQHDVVPTKNGNLSLYSFSQIMSMKIALFLKEIKIPTEFIKNVMDSIKSDNVWTNDEMWTEATKCLVIQDECDSEDSLEKVLAHRIKYRKDGKVYYLLYSLGEIMQMRHEIEYQCRWTLLYYMKPAMTKGYKEMELIAEKHEIKIPARL